MRTTKRQAADSIKEQAAVITGIEDTATVSEENQKFHPNFIESNTSGITLEELTEKNVIPTFCDNSLTISHQNFIGAVTEAAGQIFGEMTPVECRVSHPIIGRVPSAQHKKASELREERKPYSISVLHG